MLILYQIFHHLQIHYSLDVLVLLLVLRLRGFLRSFHSVEMTNKMSSRATPRDLNRMDNRKRFLRYGLREGEMTIAGSFSLLSLGLPSAMNTTQ